MQATWLKPKRLTVCVAFRKTHHVACVLCIVCIAVCIGTLLTCLGCGRTCVSVKLRHWSEKGREQDHVLCVKLKLWCSILQCTIWLCTWYDANGGTYNGCNDTGANWNSVKRDARHLDTLESRSSTIEHFMSTSGRLQIIVLKDEHIHHQRSRVIRELCVEDLLANGFNNSFCRYVGRLPISKSLLTLGNMLHVTQ
eukprot:5673223-Amphidinium_carterae.1